MARTIPFDLTGARLRWDNLTLSDPSNVRPQVSTSWRDMWRVPVSRGLSRHRLALHDATPGIYPTGAVDGDVHRATTEVIAVDALASWDLLWLPVEHNPTGVLDKTEVTIRLSDGVTEFVWDAGGGEWVEAVDDTEWTSVTDAETNFGAWSADCLGLVVRLRSDNAAHTPAWHGFAAVCTVDEGAKLQALGTTPHPLATSWQDSAIWRDMIPEIKALTFDWWGQLPVTAGAASLGFDGNLGELSIPITEVTSCRYAGADGGPFGDEIPGSWDGSDFVFDAPAPSTGEVVYVCTIAPHTNTRPDMALTERSFPLLTVVLPREAELAEVRTIEIPDVAGGRWRRWSLLTHSLEFDLRIDAHDGALAERIAQVIGVWLDVAGGRVVRSRATGKGYGIRQSRPPRPGSDFGVPSRVITIRAVDVPHYEPMADAGMVNADGLITFTTTGYTKAT